MNHSKYLPILLIFSVVSASIEIELSLPSFPDMALAFSVSEEIIAGTISLNFLGFFISSLFYGPISDLYGRRPVILIATLLFLFGSVSCAIAPTIEIMLVSRFLQGIGAAGSFVIVYAVISDTYLKNSSIYWIGILNTVLTASMTLSPILGSYLNIAFGWRSCYLFISLLTSIQLMMILLFLPETRRFSLESQGTASLELKKMFYNYSRLLSSTPFILSSLIPSLLYSGYMAFITVMPFFYQDELKLSLSQFSWNQAAIIASFSITSLSIKSLIDYLGVINSALAGSFFAALASVIFLAFSSLDYPSSALLITGLMCLFTASAAIPFAIVFATSMSLIPEKSGSASSILMSIRMLLCAITVQLSASLYNGTFISTAALTSFCCVSSLMLTVGFYRKNHQQ